MSMGDQEDKSPLRRKSIGSGTFPVDYGSVRFTAHSTPGNPEFVKCRPWVKKHLLIDHALSKWALDDHPGCLLRVTGSVASNKTAAHNEDVVLGIVQAAHIASAWILSTGLEFGIASLVGRVLNRNRHVCESPLIGIASWYSVQGCEQLESGAKGGTAEPGSKRNYSDVKPDANMATVSLQPNHTHFIFIGVAPGEEDPMVPPKDSSPEQALLFARQKSFIFAHEFEAQLRAVQMQKGVEDVTPRMLFVICGDNTTLDEILAYCRVGEGVVLLASETGGIAAALTAYIKDDTIMKGWAHAAEHFTELKKLNQIRQELMDEADALGELALEDAKEKKSANAWPLIKHTSTVFAKDVKKAILDCLIDKEPSAANRVAYAVRWDDAKRLQRELTRIPTWSDERMDILRNALQLALELENTSSVKICRENAAPVKDVDLLALYDKLYDKENPPRFSLFQGPLPTHLRRKGLEGDPSRKSTSRPTSPASPQVKFQERSKATPTVVGPTDGIQRQYSKLGDDNSPDAYAREAIKEYYPVDVWKMLQSIVPGLTLYWITKLRKLAITEMNPDSDSAPKKVQKLGARWIDVYVWAVLLGNTELAIMLLPSCQEPMRAAIIGARLCNAMGTKLPLHKVELEASALQHEEFAVKLLDLCETFDDARRMLITKSRHWNRTVIQLGLQSGLRDFCSHAHCQTLCDEWYRGNIDGESYQVILASHDTPGLIDSMRIVLQAALIKIPGFAPLTTWSLPIGVDEDDARTDPMPMHDFYNIPGVKTLLRLTFHIGYTVLVSYAVMETNMQPITENWSHIEFHEGGGLEKTSTDLMVWVWTIALALDEWFKYARDPYTFSMDFWNKYDYGCIFATFFALTMRFFSIKFAVEVMAFVVVLIWCRLFKYLALNQDIGLLVIMIMEMFNDIALWTLVSLVFLGAFTVAFVAISDPFVLHGSPDHPLTVPLWAMLGTFDVHEVQKWNPSIGAPLLWSYVVVAQIILVNLLIAMMGHTFGVIKDRADEEWKYGRLAAVTAAKERMHSLPPPLNLPITAMAFVRSALVSLQILDKASGGADTYDYARAKKAKQKVARKLMLKFKRVSELEASETMDAHVEILSENQQTLGGRIEEAITKLTNLERRLAPEAAKRLQVENVEKTSGAPSTRRLFGGGQAARQPASVSEVAPEVDRPAGES